jgi:signal peptidase II
MARVASSSGSRPVVGPAVIYASLVLAVLVFGLDRAHKHFHVAAECARLFEAVCVGGEIAYVPLSLTGWRGGEILSPLPFFDYVLVWNTGISYGLLAGMPTWVLGVVMVAAMALLAAWWWRADRPLIRIGLAVALGGALSNAVDRLIWGAVADFFHFHWAGFSFYIFNLADAAITLGVLLLILDLIGIGRSKPV